MSSNAVDPVEGAAAPPMLHRIVAAGHLRYWIIASWALALLTAVRPAWVAVWFVLTIASGLVRGLVEARIDSVPEKRRPSALRAVATASCIAWAVAPLLAWFGGQAFGRELAIGLLCTGYTLIYTQMRSAPREALIVSSPYTAALIIIASSRWQEQGFWTLVALAPVFALALLIKVVITQIRDREIRAVLARQRDLIGELEQARDQAHAASTAKSSFLGVISHELRTPMNGVLGAAQLLEAGQLAPQERTYVDIIRRSGESLLSLLNDILDMTKIEAGKMETTLTDVAITDLQERAVGPFRAQAEAKGLGFVTETTGLLPGVVRTDPLRVAQIVQNFLSNAIKFTPQGVVRLTMAAEPRPAEGRVGLTFIVADEGQGIAPEDLQRLFQPFTQVDESSTRRFGGTGLGLSIAKRMAELLGGEVDVQSTVGTGSEFRFSLEVEVVDWGKAPIQDAPRSVEPQLATRPLNVLVVEDHPVNRMILDRWLSTMGHEVALAANGRDAIDQAAHQAFDLILMDVNMPVMDGLEATRRIREGAGPNQDAPIAVLSASARPEDHQLGLDAGADLSRQTGRLRSGYSRPALGPDGSKRLPAACGHLGSGMRVRRRVSAGSPSLALGQRPSAIVALICHRAPRGHRRVKR